MPEKSSREETVLIGFERFNVRSAGQTINNITDLPLPPLSDRLRIQSFAHSLAVDCHNLDSKVTSRVLYAIMKESRDDCSFDYFMREFLAARTRLRQQRRDSLC